LQYHFCVYAAMQATRGRDEHCTGLGLGWIQSIANFVEFGLDLYCKSLRHLGTGPDLEWVNGKEMRHFCCGKAAFFKYFGLGLHIWKIFWTVVGLGLSF